MIHSVDMKVLSGPHCCYSDVPNNEGFTCVAVLDFSHIAIHFWDKCEQPFFEFDLFSCKDFDINIPIEMMKRFDMTTLGIQFINRDLFKDKPATNYTSDKIHVVYKTINKINQRYYIGKHSFTRIADGYIGSGVLLKKAIKKYGKENFYCQHLKYFSNEQDAYDYEKQLITDEVLFDSKNYNVRVGGSGYSANEVTKETRQKQSNAQKKRIGKPGTTTGKSFFNNGKIEKLYFINDAPSNWKKGRLVNSLRGIQKEVTHEFTKE